MLLLRPVTLCWCLLCCSHVTGIQVEPGPAMSRCHTPRAGSAWQGRDRQCWPLCCAVGRGKELPAGAPSCWQGAEVLGPEDGVGGWTRKHRSQPDSFMDPTAPSSNPFPVVLPGGSARRKKLNTLIRQVWLSSPFFVIITDLSSSVGFSFISLP